jgi:hypothetical protein
MEAGDIADGAGTEAGAGAEAGDMGPGAGATGTMAGDTLAILAMAAEAMAATIAGRSFSSASPGPLGFDDL